MDEIVLDEFLPLEYAGHSSKGNQLKWKADNIWYKADYMGYESLAEVVVSGLLAYSDVENYVRYLPVEIQYKGKKYMGCKSNSFLGEGEEFVTAEHLFRQWKGGSLSAEMSKIPNVEGRIEYMVENVINFTGLVQFGKYIAIILAMDAFFLNEDRHTNNIGVIYEMETKTYRLSPVFDNGLAMLADTMTDFSLEKSLEECMKRVEAKPFSRNFDEQLDAAEKLYGSNMHFSFGKKEVDRVLESCVCKYSDEIIGRVRDLLYFQMRKYQYMFNSHNVIK